jgi:hypothetical protein
VSATWKYHEKDSLLMESGLLDPMRPLRGGLSECYLNRSVKCNNLCSALTDYGEVLKRTKFTLKPGLTFDVPAPR